MRRKVRAGAAAVILVFAAGTSALAVGGDWSFENMLPHMKQIHPEFTDEQLEGMYRSCRGGNGVMPRMHHGHDLRHRMSPYSY